MADIQAFRGLRFDLSKVGSLSEVVAPPYDVISVEARDQLYESNEFNVVRLILNRGDNLLPDQTVYERAAEHLKNWKNESVLRPDGVGAIYVYHQTFKVDGIEYTRRGFIARVRIEPFGEGNIYPHEKTHSKAKEDRYQLMEACNSNLSPIFGIYSDQESSPQAILDLAIDDRTPLTAIDEEGVRHDLWMVTDANAVAAAAQLMGPTAIYIADGHHRYETATSIRNSRRQGEELEPDHPVDYTMIMCVGMDDPGLVVLPTHRLFRGVSPMTSADLIAKLSAAFDCEVVGSGIALASDCWEAVQVEGEQSTMAFYCRKDDTWVLARIRLEGVEMMEGLAEGKSECWQSLGVAILHELVLDHLLGCRELPSPRYVHGIDEVVALLRSGDGNERDATGQQGTGDFFELACLVMPATVSDVKSISESGERMPAKSTYFYPKLLSGLVINPLD
ncbi:MAG: DUF1015 domain-containing protein [Mariniblastus sp.]|nr:DUF1015 domain-containing protein [Mariniblastus sp.]